jgi:hypothetical protein
VRNRPADWYVVVSFLLILQIKSSTLTKGTRGGRLLSIYVLSNGTKSGSANTESGLKKECKVPQETQTKE